MSCAVDPGTDENWLAALDSAHKAIVIVHIGAGLVGIFTTELQSVAGLDVILDARSLPTTAGKGVVPAHSIEQLVATGDRRHFVLLPQRIRQRHAEAEPVLAVALVERRQRQCD